VTAGGFVYLAAAELMPELQRDRSSRVLAAQLLWMLVGIGSMAALKLLE
jgi:zinc transporter ZupT